MKMLSKLKSYPALPIKYTVTVVPNFNSQYERIQQIGKEAEMLSSSYVEIERKIESAARQAQRSSEHGEMLVFNLQREELMGKKRELETRLNNLKDAQFSEFLELVDFACKPLNPDNEIDKSILEEHQVLMKMFYLIVQAEQSAQTSQLERPEEHYDNRLDKRLIFSQFLKQFSRYLTQLADKGESILLLGSFGIKSAKFLSIQIERLRDLIANLCKEQSKNLNAIIHLKEKIRKKAQNVKREGQFMLEENSALKPIDKLANLKQTQHLIRKNEEIIVARRKQFERQHKASYARSLSLHQKSNARAVQEKRKQQDNEAQIKATDELIKNFKMAEGKRKAEEQMMKERTEKIQAEMRAEQAAEEWSAIKKELKTDRQ